MQMDSARDVSHTINLSFTFNLLGSENQESAPIHSSLDNHVVSAVARGENEHDKKALEARYKEHEKEYFLMNKKPKGQVLLINNDFKTHDGMQTRIGSRVDEDNLKTAFESLGGSAEGSQVDVSLYRNLPAEKIKKLLELFADVKILPSFAAVVIMSHGDGGVNSDDFVIGNDGTPCNVKELVDVFKSQPAWKDIPVLMFFQMCRGSGVNESQFQEVTAVNADQTDAAPVVENVPRRTSEDTRAMLRDRLRYYLPNSTLIGTDERTSNDQAGSQLADGLDHHSSVYVGNEPNTLISFATTEGKASIRNPDNGSWYIQELCEAIKAMSKEGGDLVETMRKVHIEVNSRRSENFPGLTMACDSSHSFQKKLEFFPGYPKK